MNGERLRALRHGCLISAVTLYLMARKRNRYPSAMTKITSANEDAESEQR
jgi:hypothetical protein